VADADAGTAPDEPAASAFATEPQSESEGAHVSSEYNESGCARVLCAGAAATGEPMPLAGAAAPPPVAATGRSPHAPPPGAPVVVGVALAAAAPVWAIVNGELDVSFCGLGETEPADVTTKESEAAAADGDDAAAGDDACLLPPLGVALLALVTLKPVLAALPCEWGASRVWFLPCGCWCCCWCCF